MGTHLYAKLSFLRPTGEAFCGVSIVHVDNLDAFTDEAAMRLLKAMAHDEAKAMQCSCISAEWISSVEAAELMRKRRGVSEEDVDE